MYKFFIFEQTYFRGENMKRRLKTTKAAITIKVIDHQVNG